MVAKFELEFGVEWVKVPRMAKIIGTGSYLPETIVEDSEFADERFRLRSGSARRRHASPDETSFYMSERAAKAALDAAGVQGEDLDLILGYSGMPDFLYPKDSNLLIESLGARKAAVWNIDTACATGISGLAMAHAQLHAGLAQKALIVTTMSWVNRGIDKATTDYSSIGDGAAAIVLEASDGGLEGVVERTDPDGFDFVQLPSPFATGAAEQITFSADPKYRAYFGSTVLGVVQDVFEKTGFSGEDIDWFIPHQVGPTLLQIWSKQLGIDPSKLLHTYAETGNMSAVNVPHILDTYVRDGTIKRGDRLLLFAPGAGMHLAAMVWEY